MTGPQLALLLLAILAAPHLTQQQLSTFVGSLSWSDWIGLFVLFVATEPTTPLTRRGAEKLLEKLRPKS